MQFINFSVKYKPVMFDFLVLYGYIDELIKKYLFMRDPETI